MTSSARISHHNQIQRFELYILGAFFAPDGPTGSREFLGAKNRAFRSNLFYRSAAKKYFHFNPLRGNAREAVKSRYSKIYPNFETISFLP
jgi:hypothetical protein